MTTPRHITPKPARKYSFWYPRLTSEPGHESRGGSLHSYEYVGKHHPDAFKAYPLRSGWWDRAKA